MSSVDTSPSSDAKLAKVLKNLNVSLHSASLCWGPREMQSVRDKLWAGSRRERVHANSINWRAWQELPVFTGLWALPGKVLVLEDSTQRAGVAAL